MATLGFRITVDGLDDDTLVVREYQGHESVSNSLDEQGKPCYGFRYQIDLASRRTDLSAEQMVDASALFEVLRNGEVVQRVHGIIRAFGKGDTGHTHTFYSITLVPALERLSLRHNSRIFQQRSAPEIMSTLLVEMNITDCAFSLKREMHKREFCVQYRETDLQFLHRLAAEEGMVYSFIHQEDKHLLLFTDNNDGLARLESPVAYNVLSGGAIDTVYVSQFTQYIQAEVSQSKLQDYSFKQPSYRFAQEAQASDIAYQRDDYEHYDFPGRFKNDVVGKAFNAIRLEYLRRRAHTATGQSNHAGLQAGTVFDLTGHLDASNNRDWLVIDVRHQGSQPQALEESAGTGQTTYANQFTAIPADKVWRAEPQRKPQMEGPCIATVTGPDGEEIFCDEFGRVKLHFPWDRYNNADELSSCWVRVSQGWAGSQYGMMAVPRVGHEVIVSFLNNDPDQPIITGRTYHATNQAPYPLPANKTKTVLRTETHQGQGFNELSFEDQSGSELIYLHAQKDVEVLLENDHTTDIKHDQHLTVDNDRYTQIKVDDHCTVDGEQRINIKGNQSVEMDGSLQQKVAQKTVLDAGQEVHLKAGNKVVLDAGNEITIKVGGSFVKVDAAGVHIVGPAIGLNSGGSAGSGSGYAGLAASLPKVLKAMPIPAELVQPEISASVIQQVKADVIAGVPITQTCQKRPDGTCPLSDCPCGNNVA
jgi:type VI secretion system secreted protein VgrG